MDLYRSATLLPPLPHERQGWGRFCRILRAYPTAPIELLCGFGAVGRGLYVGIADVHVTFRVLPNLPPQVLALIMAGLGLLQLYGCIWEKGRCRAAAGILLAIMFSWLVGVYNDISGIWSTPASALPMFYALLAMGEVWVASRTPALLPLWRWTHRARARLSSGPNRSIP